MARSDQAGTLPDVPGAADNAFWHMLDKERFITECRGEHTYPARNPRLVRLTLAGGQIRQAVPA
jgi:hypothetical protein